MSTDSGLLTSSETPGISARGQGIDGIHWNILGQVYTPKSITERCFSWHAMLPIESFVPPHIHPTQDEYIQVLSGELDLLLDGKRQRAQAGDLVRMPMGIAHGIFNNSGADATLAEECAQDVMTTLWHKAGQFDPGKASVATWVFTIARNRRIDMLRRQRRVEPDDLPWGPEPEPDQSDVLALQQETEGLTVALKSLPAEQRDLIQQAYFNDMTQSEIAKITGLPLGTIKSRIRLALDRLRHAMN
jgi:RNA polymerase sigma-70 factor (ECF subfamily)